MRVLVFGQSGQVAQELQRLGGQTDLAHRIGIKGMQPDPRQAQQGKDHHAGKHQQRKQRPGGLHLRKGRERAKPQSEGRKKRNRHETGIYLRAPRGLPLRKAARVFLPKPHFGGAELLQDAGQMPPLRRIEGKLP